MDEFVEQFLIECRELVEQGTADLLALEEEPSDDARLDGAFRAFHTLKGAAGIVDFAAMGRALHAAEDVLARVRSGERPVSVKLISDCLTCLDQVVQWLDRMQDTGAPPPEAEAEADILAARFAEYAAEVAPATLVPNGSSPSILPAMARALLEAQLGLLGEASAEPMAGRHASATAVAANVLRVSGHSDQADAVMKAKTSEGLIGILRDVISGASTASADAVLPRGHDVARILRVEVERVDALVKITSELTVIKSALGHLSSQAHADADFQSIAAGLKTQHEQFDRQINELHRAVLRVRVLPLGHVFQRFPRLVREMAAATAKPVKLVVEGDATEADKVVVESLFEPLLHVMRNAVDHGIEPPAARRAAGKPETAILSLSGRRQGDHVVIEVADDGAGIDVQRIRQVAANRGLATDDALDAMPDAAVIDLIFAPGFSTATEVSDLSGRGVGMDAVRTAVERLGGRVKLASQPGAGTTVQFVMPFSVMISRVMTVQAGGQMFGVPLDAIVETVRTPRTAIKPIGAGRVLVRRDRTIPVIDLAQALGREGETSDDRNVHIVIAAMAGELAGIEVDRLGERMDVMLKPMDGLLAGMPGVAGTTVLADGQVLIVLDLQELLR